jgi:hypothetical protein
VRATYIAGFVCSHGHAFVRQVGYSQQQGLELNLQGLQALRRAAELLADARHLGEQAVDRLALALADADLLRQRVAARLQLFGARLQRCSSSAEKRATSRKGCGSLRRDRRSTTPSRSRRNRFTSSISRLHGAQGRPASAAEAGF